MDGYTQECKLCDKVITDENFKVIDDVMKTSFHFLLLKLTLDNGIKNVICTMCSSRLLSALNFKSTCIHTDNTLIPYADFENPTLVDLKEAYRKENVRGHEICRLCLHLISSDHKSIQEVPVEAIQIYIPEINFSVTRNPVICIKCHDALGVHSSFIKNCLEVEKNRSRVTTDVSELLLSDPCIKTEEIEIKDEKIDDETVYEILCKQEDQENEEGDIFLRSQNDLAGIEETKSLYDPVDLKPTSVESTSANYGSKNIYLVEHLWTYKGPSEVETYECNQCSYQAKRKLDLKRHQLTHRDRSESQMYKCEECAFETKHKGYLKKHQLIHKNPSEVPMFECDGCEFKSIDKGQLKRHQLRHKDRSEVPMYKCDRCGFETKHKRYIKRHLLRHEDPSEVQTYECDKCDYKSIHKRDLKKHELRHKNPSEVQMYKCDECEYETKYKGSIKKHQLIHKDPSEVQKYECGECDFKSIHKRGLKKHELRHKDPSDLQMHDCSQCGYKTKRIDSLKRHQLIHKNPSEVQMYACEKCKFTSKRKKSLKRHLLRHPTQV